MLFSQPFLIDLQREEGLTPGQKEELMERLLKEAHNRDILTLLKDVSFIKLIKSSSYSSEAMIFMLSKAPANTNIKGVVELVGLEQTKQDNIMSALQAVRTEGKIEQIKELLAQGLLTKPQADILLKKLRKK
jgi:hypothetical protein